MGDEEIKQECAMSLMGFGDVLEMLKCDESKAY